MLSRQDKGDLVEAYFIYLCHSKGWKVAIPSSSSLEYDVAFKMPGKKWQAVQCKYVNDTLKLDLRRGPRRSRKYDKSDWDHLFCYNETSKRSWLIPMNKIVGRVTLRIKKFNEYEIK